MVYQVKYDDGFHHAGTATFSTREDADNFARAVAGSGYAVEQSSVLRDVAMIGLVVVTVALMLVMAAADWTFFVS